MIFYVATRGSERGITRARKVRDALNAAGHSWSFDWTIDMEKNFAAGKRDTDLTQAEKEEYAERDREAVIDADLVIYLEDEKSEGSACEVAYADAFEIEVWAVCPGVPRCLFVCLADRFFVTDDELIEAVLAEDWENRAPIRETDWRDDDRPAEEG